MLGHDERSVLVAAPAGPTLGPLADLLARHPELAERFALATPREIRRALIERHAAALVARAVGAIRDRDPTASAARVAETAQVAFLALALLAWIAAVFDLSEPLLVAWSLVFLALGGLRLRVADTLVGPPAHPPLAEAALPSFAVLVPLHREAEVVGDLVAALGRLDYPADRLVLRLVVEADDAATRAAASAAVAGTPIELVEVPPALPRTKPKALNFALATVDTDFVSVFDAEDRPDPDQLRRAAAAFAAGPADLGVVQAALDIDHADSARPWLVRQFEIEYAALFRGLLPWLARRGWFLPLGGTSNHFRRAALDDVGGWDPHNVTEDADIAVRLLRRGWKADVVASATREEAPLDWPAWRAQRTRWVKGWMQTWLVHMRRPIAFHREVGLASALAFHLVIAGQIVSVVAFAPSLALLALQSLGLHILFRDRDFSGDLVLMTGLVGFCCGLLGTIVLARRVTAGTARPARLLDLATLPFYWCLISWAGFRALAELAAAPHRWNKTTHGLAERTDEASTVPPDGAQPSTAPDRLLRPARRRGYG